MFSEDLFFVIRTVLRVCGFGVLFIMIFAREIEYLGITRSIKRFMAVCLIFCTLPWIGEYHVIPMYPPMVYVLNALGVYGGCELIARWPAMPDLDENSKEGKMLKKAIDNGGFKYKRHGKLINLCLVIVAAVTVICTALYFAVGEDTVLSHILEPLIVVAVGYTELIENRDKVVERAFERIQHETEVAEIEKRNKIKAEEKAKAEEAKAKLHEEHERDVDVLTAYAREVWEKEKPAAQTLIEKEWLKAAERAIPARKIVANRYYVLTDNRHEESFKDTAASYVIRSRNELYNFGKTYYEGVIPYDFYLANKDTYKDVFAKKLSGYTCEFIIDFPEVAKDLKIEMAANGYSHNISQKTENAAGESAEKNVQYALSWWARTNGSIVIKKDCRSKYSDNCIRIMPDGSVNEPQEFDHLLVTPAGIISIETKDYAGEIRVIDTDTWERTYPDGSVELTKSPAAQVKRHDYVLSTFASQFKIHSMILLANENSKLTGEENSAVKIITFRSLESALDKINEEKLYSADQIKQIADEINKRKVKS